ncbi:MAG: hypothetical protein Q7R56_01175 [Nanoarchaeota archaeon]|nr:hypothetical protein [Nanoarchaeota archaeon]
MKTPSPASTAYHFLTDKLDEITWALKGECNDIDCDHYLYKNLLKKDYSVLSHHTSCIEALQQEKEAIVYLLSQKKFKLYRYETCPVCKNKVDKLSKLGTIISFTRPAKQKGYYEWKGFWTHKKCQKKAKIPEGWKKR